MMITVVIIGAAILVLAVGGLIVMLRGPSCGRRCCLPTSNKLTSRLPSAQARPASDPGKTAHSRADAHHDDVVKVHVVLCARQRHHAIVTSDPRDIARIDPAVPRILV